MFRLKTNEAYIQYGMMQHYATSHNVAGSIPFKVIVLRIYPIPSARTMSPAIDSASKISNLSEEGGS
jgi:hypothetical protein